MNPTPRQEAAAQFANWQQHYYGTKYKLEHDPETKRRAIRLLQADAQASLSSGTSSGGKE